MLTLWPSHSNNLLIRLVRTVDHKVAALIDPDAGAVIAGELVGEAGGEGQAPWRSTLHLVWAGTVHYQTVKNAYLTDAIVDLPLESAKRVVGIGVGVVRGIVSILSSQIR